MKITKVTIAMALAAAGFFAVAAAAQPDGGMPYTHISASAQPDSGMPYD